MKVRNIIASVAVAGGFAAGALGVGAGIASADTGPGHGGPVATRWGPPPPHHDQWGGPGPWNGGGGYYNGGWGGGYGGGPFPGGWNGGWEPNGGFCLGPFCV